MATHDPSASVRRKPKAAGAKLPSAKGLPEFSAPNYSDVVKNHLRDLGSEIEPELNYLKRLSLRSKLANTDYSKFVPCASDRELATGEWLEQLNAINASADANQRATLELLFARFNTRSVFNIACELANLRLQKQSVKEIEALIDNGPVGFVNQLLGPTAADKAAQRRAYSAPAPRT